jgi:catechol 2,3-dioxygenase-like lactoylglutathione lyase family enzyme
MNESQSAGDNDFEFGSSIPVLRMLDEAKARAFYLDYLGFEVDWEHRFRPTEDSDLYMQLHLGNAVVHLNGHASEDSPITEVRIPVTGISAFCAHLRAKNAPYEKPDVGDPRYEGKPSDLNLYDPFGNLLVFWAPHNN